MKKVDLVQRSEAWKQFRASRVMASDVPVIMGISPYKTPYKLFMQKIGMEEEDPITPAMQRGIDNEEAALALFNSMTGLNASPCVVVHPEIDWLGASLDGLSEDGQTLVEIKCNGHEKHELAKQGIVCDMHFCQMQVQRFVAGIVQGKYFSYDVDRKEGVIVDVAYDAQHVASMFPLLSKFHEDRTKLIPPAMMPRDCVQKSSEEWKYQVDLYRGLDKEIKALTKQRDEAREKLIELAEGHSAEGFGMKVLKTVVAGRIKYDEIPQLKGLDLEYYRSETTVQWRLYPGK